MIPALSSDCCTDMWKIAVRHHDGFWIGYAQVQFKYLMVAKRLACQPGYNREVSWLQIRSCMFGQHEKPVNPPKTGSAIVVYNIDREATPLKVRKFFEQFGLVNYIHLGKFAFVEPCSLS